MNQDQSSWPIPGMRVLELATGIAGPYAGKMLCDAGADVIKLERPEGDPLRCFTACGRALAAGEDSALFRYLNASKRSIVADPGERGGEALALELATRSDVLIESDGPGGLESRGLSLEALHAANPALVVVSISPWGLMGPWAERPATEFTLQAVCGAATRRGLPDRTPIASGGQLGCFATGAYAGASALAAWIEARRSGEGQHLDAALFEGVITVLTTFFALKGHWVDEPLALAAEAPSIEPARDGWVGICTYTAQQWKDFCALIQRPDLGEDERFHHASFRFENRDLVAKAIADWTSERTVEEIVELASLMRVPSAPVLDAAGVLECDHFQERGVFVEGPGGIRPPRVPYKLGLGETRPLGPAPSLDEHGDAIRAELASGSLRPAIAQGEGEGAGGSDLPFEGLRIIDLTAFWAGPVVTSFFADLGADVVKVESTKRPDGMRFVGSSGNQPLWEWSEVFHGVNPGKRSITLNLDSQEGKALLIRLLESADVLTENASARVLENFGLGYETLRKINPRLVVLRMPAWGLDGPWRDRPGFAANIEQASGVAWLTGYADLPFVPAACDPIGGIHAAFGVMAALEIRRRTGEGQQVESSLVEPALNVAAALTLEWQAYGEMLMREENRGPTASPQGLFRCQPPRDERDPEWLAIAVENDAQWEGLRRALGDPEWAREIALTSEAGRRAAQDAIETGISGWAAGLRAREAETVLLAEGVPAAAAVNAHFLVGNEQLESRGFFQTLEHPVTGSTPYAVLPVRFSKRRCGRHASPPPTMGQHNEEVLGGELGLSSAEIEALLQKKVIGHQPEF
ncbi:MAG: CoA transferase [Deltaproteobacteria bacterium]|nr:CoA transferase [Deltaproteobacteria bacterium]